MKKELVKAFRSLGALATFFLVVHATTDPVDALFISVFSVVGWLTLYDLLYSEVTK